MYCLPGSERLRRSCLLWRSSNSLGLGAKLRQKRTWSCCVFWRSCWTACVMILAFLPCNGIGERDDFRATAFRLLEFAEGELRQQRLHPAPAEEGWNRFQNIQNLQTALARRWLVGNRQNIMQHCQKLQERPWCRLFLPETVPFSESQMHSFAHIRICFSTSPRRLWRSASDSWMWPAAAEACRKGTFYMGNSMDLLWYADDRGIQKNCVSLHSWENFHVHCCFVGSEPEHPDHLWLDYPSKSFWVLAI